MIDRSLECLIGFIEEIEVLPQNDYFFKVIIRTSKLEININVSLKDLIHMLKYADNSNSLSELLDILICPTWLLSLYNFYKVITSEVFNKLIDPVCLSISIPENIGRLFISEFEQELPYPDGLKYKDGKLIYSIYLED
jgi:hypothetical protein